MVVYYSLRALANLVADVRGVLLDFAEDIREVWLIGRWLTVWILLLAHRAAILQIRVLDLAEDWRDIYDYIVDNLGGGFDVSKLIPWIDDLVDFIRAPGVWLRNTLYWYFPALRDLFSDPVAYVLETIYNYTGLSYNFVHNPRGAIRDILRDLLGRLWDAVDDPIFWLRDAFRDAFPNAFDLVFDPDGWLRDRLDDLFPSLREFLRDPDGFILDRVLSGFERLFDQLAPRLTKIAEKIIGAMF